MIDKVNIIVYNIFIIKIKELKDYGKDKTKQETTEIQ